MTALQYNHGQAVLPFIRQGDMYADDLVFPAYLKRSAVKPETGFAARMVKDLNISPPDPFPHAQTDGL
jgi:hypothetical protein